MFFLMVIPPLKMVPGTTGVIVFQTETGTIFSGSIVNMLYFIIPICLSHLFTPAFDVATLFRATA